MRQVTLRGVISSERTLHFFGTLFGICRVLLLVAVPVFGTMQCIQCISQARALASASLTVSYYNIAVSMAIRILLIGALVIFYGIAVKTCRDARSGELQQALSSF